MNDNYTRKLNQNLLSGEELCSKYLRNKPKNQIHQNLLIIRYTTVVLIFTYTTSTLLEFSCYIFNVIFRQNIKNCAQLTQPD